MGIISEPREREEIIRTAIYQQPVAQVCDKCGRRDDFGDDGYPDLSWVPITVAAGEESQEGFEEAERIFCEDCSYEVLVTLIGLGFGTHFHGSNLLEADCVPNPYENCPTPSKGPYDDEDD